MADQLLGGIVINEILADPNGAINFDTDGSGTFDNVDEFTELYNASGGPIDISGLQLWDAGVGHYFTFPSGTILQSGAHALVITGLSGGSLPTGGSNDLAFSAGRGAAVINNGGDNVVLYDPTNDEYISATFNGDSLDDPTTTYSGFSGTATQVGAGEDFGNDTDGESLQRASDGTDTFVSDGPTPATTNVCFTNGTEFDTADGARLIDGVKAGDTLRTLDHGIQTVKWVYAKTWSAQQIKDMPNLAPVVISAGALGQGLPRRDLRVSQQHRILVRGPIVLRMFDTSEVLIAAKHLLAVQGVYLDQPVAPVTYFHVMLKQHEILFAEGLPTESLYLGRQSLKAIPDAGLREIELLLGLKIAAFEGQIPAPARMFATGKRAKTLVRRHAKNAQPLIKGTHHALA
jgi:hypothetical protein